MRLAINVLLSLGMLALCTWLVWPDATEAEHLRDVIGTLRWADLAPYLAGYLGLLIVVHLCRSLRWNHLLAPLGVKVPPGPLLAISSVGFMAILALPARLGEFVRPGLLRKGGYTTTAAALGTAEKIAGYTHSLTGPIADAPISLPRTFAKYAGKGTRSLVNATAEGEGMFSGAASGLRDLMPVRFDESGRAINAGLKTEFGARTRAVARASRDLFTRG